MLAIVMTAALNGLQSVPIQVEVDVAKQSFPGFSVVGLPDKSVDEAKERVRSALRNSSAEFPQHRITVNLAPADIPKNGSAYDLAIAIGLLVASEQLIIDTKELWFFGELSLDGRLRPTTGMLALAAAAKKSGARQIYVPQANAEEAAAIPGLEVYGVDSLGQLFLHLQKVVTLTPSQEYVWSEALDREESDIDFCDISGQEQSKRSLEVAAAGGHNVLLSGLPGSGKTLLAKAYASILPPLTSQEALEISTIHSISGLLVNQPMLQKRPFRSPHHTTSSIGMIGGGTIPKPGEVSLAHKGVLFLDEFPEFPRSVLEVLRQPLEDGVVSVSRAKASYTFPARFQLLAAQNPCPCGHQGDPERACQCNPHQLSQYQKRISGPLLDRIDIYVTVPRVSRAHLLDKEPTSGESSSVIRKRVIRARKQQLDRLASAKLSCNAEMTTKLTKQYCQLDDRGLTLMESAVVKLHLSARGYFRVLRVARTIADLAGHNDIQVEHLAEALQYRRNEP